MGWMSTFTPIGLRTPERLTLRPRRCLPGRAARFRPLFLVVESGAYVKSRDHIPVATRRAAWRRAKGCCEECGTNLIERSIVNVPAEKISYLVHVWNGHACWRCHSVGRILEVTDSQNSDFRYLDSDAPDERKLGEAVRKRFPFFHPDYSYTMEMSYYANHCESCGAADRQACAVRENGQAAVFAVGLDAHHAFQVDEEKEQPEHEDARPQYRFQAL